MKAFVTGAAGFIGSHISRWLIKDGFEVVGLDDLSGGNAKNLPAGIKFIQGSITDYQLLCNIFDREKFDYVYHIGAYAAEGLSHFIRRYNYENNLLGSINLINLSIKHKIKCFVFTSSIAVYGSNQVPMNEEMVPQPEDPYGISKYAVELDLRAANKQFGLNYIIFRPHNVYGEHQNMADKYRNAIGIFMNQILSGKPMTIFGDGTQTRAFSYIDDVAPVIARSVLNPRAYGEVFNVGGDVVFSVKELAEIVAEEMGMTPCVKSLRKRNEVLHAFASHEKAKRFFDIPPPVSLKEGIRKMAVWAKSVGIQKPKNFTAIEISENLPEGW